MGKRGPAPSDSPRSKLTAVRLPTALAENIESAAKSKGKSISEELVNRLERTFTDDKHIVDAFGHVDNYLLMKLASFALQKSDNWLHDANAFDSCMRTLVDVLERVRPGGPRDARELAMSILGEDVGASLYADALWSVVQEATAAKPLQLRTDIEHLALRLKSQMGDVVMRPDPLAGSRRDARERLASAFPDEDFSKVEDNVLFERLSALNAEIDARLSSYQHDMRFTGPKQGEGTDG